MNRHETIAPLPKVPARIIATITIIAATITIIAAAATIMLTTTTYQHLKLPPMVLNPRVIRTIRLNPIHLLIRFLLWLGGD